MSRYQKIIYTQSSKSRHLRLLLLLLFSGFGIIGMGLGCKKSSQAPPLCSILLSPSPGFYHNPISVALASTHTPIRFHLETLPLREAPVTYPAQGAEVSAPAFYRTYQNPISLSEGFHQLRIQDPCTGKWKKYLYLVDETPPLLFLSPEPGSFRTPITVYVMVNDPSALVYARVYPKGGNPPPLDPLPQRQILLLQDGTFIIEARAQDPLGNTSIPVTAEYTVDTSSATLLEFQLFSDPNNASPLPLLRARFDLPMDTYMTVLPQAVSYTNQSGQVDLLLFWRSPFEVDMIPAQRLREGAAVKVNIRGIRSSLGGSIFEPSTPPPFLDFRVCTGCILEPFAARIQFDSYLIPATESFVTFTLEVHPVQVQPNFRIYAQAPSLITTPLDLGITQPVTGITPLGNGRYTATLATDWISGGEAVRLLIIGNRLQGTPYHLLAHLLKEGDSSQAPVTPPEIVTAYPSSALTDAAPWDELWIQSSVPLNPRTVQEGATLTVNGSNQSFYVVPLDLASPTTLRIVPANIPFRGGDQVSFAVANPSLVYDLWGRSLASPFSVDFTVATYPGGDNPPPLLWGWDREPGSKVYIGPLVPILTGWVEPHVESLEVLVRDLATMRPIDGFFVEHFPRRFLRFSQRSRSLFIVATEPWMPTLPTGRILRIEITPRVNPDLPLYGYPLIITLVTAASSSEEPLNIHFSSPGLHGNLITRNDGVFLDSYFLTLMKVITVPLKGQLEILDANQNPITQVELAPVTVASLLDAVTHPGVTQGEPRIELDFSRSSSEPSFLGELLLKFVCLDGSGAAHPGPTTDPTCLANKPYLVYSFDHGASWSPPLSAVTDRILLPYSLDLLLNAQSPPPIFEGPTAELPGEEYRFLLWTAVYTHYQLGNALLSQFAPYPLTAFPPHGFVHFMIDHTPQDRRVWSRPYDLLPTESVPQPITPPQEFTAAVTQGILFQWSVTRSLELDALVLQLYSSSTTPPLIWQITLPPNSTRYYLDHHLCPRPICQSGLPFSWVLRGMRLSGIPEVLYSSDLEAQFQTYLRGSSLSFPPHNLYPP